MSALRHIEGKTYRFHGYYVEHYVDDGMFMAYLCEAGYGTQKVWANVSLDSGGHRGHSQTPGGDGVIEKWDDRDNHMTVTQPFENELPGIDFDDGESIRQREADEAPKVVAFPLSRLAFRNDLRLRITRMMLDIAHGQDVDQNLLLCLLSDARSELR